MEEKDVNQIRYIIGKLRVITRAVQVAPFVYAGIYILCMFAYLFVSEEVCSILDTLFYTSPLMLVIFLIQSKILKLCRWHRTACILPIIPQISVLIDSYITDLSEAYATVSICLPIAMMLILLVAAYKVFIANGQ